MSSLIKANTAFTQNIHTLAKAADKKENVAMGEQVSELAHQKKTEKSTLPTSVVNKKQLNVAILESTLKFNTSAASQPLSLLLKTALQGINESLQDAGVENSVEDAYQSGIDFSPEATAERVVAFSTQFFSVYQKQNPQQELQQALTEFADIIGKGIEQGFGEARGVLSSVEVLEGDIADNIDKTYELVSLGLRSFVENYAGSEQETAQ